MAKIATSLLAILVGLIALGGAHSAYGGSGDTPEEIAKQASPAVVRIAAYKKVPVRAVYITERGGQLYFKEETESLSVAASSGSGFFVTADGYILTNRHVVEDDAEYAVLSGGEEVPANVAYRDPEYDLAVLKIDGKGFPVLALDDSKPEIDSAVVAMGHAFGTFADSATSGVVTSQEKDIAVDGEIVRRGRYLLLSYSKLSGLIESTAKVYPGDSGGPLLDSKGKVVGVNVATAVGKRIGYAVPAEAAHQALERAGIEL